MNIKDILEPKEYDLLNQFTQEDKDWINERINVRKDGKPGVECVVRGMNSEGDYFKLTPEEIIRQYYAYKLISEYKYDKSQLSFEEPVIFAGRETINDKRIDIAVFDEEHKNIIMIIEVKRPKIDDYNKTWEGESTTPFQQMQTYCNQKHPQVGVLVNGVKDPEFYDFPDYENQLELKHFPQANEDIQEWKDKRRFTLKQLMQSDRLQTEILKDIILNVEQRFGANDSSDKAFEEIFKLIFTKLYDEKMSSTDAADIASDISRHKMLLKDIDDSQFRVMEFRATENDSPDSVYNKINTLFGRAQMQWQGVFPPNSTLNMQKATVKSCVKELQNVKLFNSNLEVVDDAFEHLVNQNQKEGMGQYFTPRYVIDMCVKMLNPKSNEKMIDTAAGSCGFPMHSVFHVWKQINPEAHNLFTARRRKPEETEYVQNNVFGIDFSEKSVRVGRMLNIIAGAGDGHTNVIELNSLDFKNWESDYVTRPEWQAKYGEGFRKLVALSADGSASNSANKYKYFNFDVLMANPPFAGDLDNKEQIEQYDLGHKGGNPGDKLQNRIGRDILFIERNLNFLKPGGRMAVVLPQGRFNNSTDKYIRDYIMKQCRLLAVVGLHGNTFKPHTGTKTSVLLVQKWTDENGICPRPAADINGDIDYPIFFATMQEPSKDNSGDKIYVTENYVTWTSYKYVTVKTIMRKSDNTILTENEYNVISDKNNYEKVIKETLYFRKSDNAPATEADYNAKKNDFKKKNVYEYKRMLDSVVLSENDYREITKKSNYSIKIETVALPEEHRNEEGRTSFIKDLFIDKYGSIESHKKWIQKNTVFVLRNTIEETELEETIRIDEWLTLDTKTKALYKESDVLGENPNPEITNKEYKALSSEAQKYYLVAEDVKESVERVKDTHGQTFVKHDLFNHDPALKNANPNNIYSQNGIAEAFIKFAYDNGLSFAPTDEELNKIMHPENEFPFLAGLSCDDVFNNLLERLEISIIKYTKLRETEEFRIDDAYYDKNYLEIYDKLERADQLEKIVKMHDVSSNGSFAFVQAVLNENGEKTVPYIRSGNVGEFFIDSDSLIKITSKAHGILKLSHTKLHDVMMARKGKIGGASIIMEKEVGYNCNENVIKLTILNENINPFYFVTFFNSKYGIKQVKRLSTGNVQPWLSIYQIRKLLFLPLSKQFQDEVEKIVREAYGYYDSYKQKYLKAGNILLESLEMMEWESANEAVSIRALKEIEKTSRIDAEYYQPKYDNLFAKLNEHKCKLLGEITSIKKSIEPGSEAYLEKGVPFYRVSNISKERLSEPEVFLDEEKYYTDELTPKKDTILFSKDGSIGIAYKVEEDMKAITSSALLHINVIDETILPDYLTLVLNSEVVKLQAERDAGGSIIQHWKPDEIAKVLIPILDMKIQKVIVDLIKSSFSLQKESKILLEKAKNMVEVAIEYGEDKALELLKE